MPGAGTSTQNQTANQTQQSAGTNNSSNQGTTLGTQSQSSGPWSATQPLLSNIITSLQGLSATPSPAQSEAVAGLQSAANAIPSFGSAAGGVVGDLMSASPRYSGMLGDALSGYHSSLSPYLAGTYLDPMSTPGLADALGTVKSDISNSINDQFARAGRDLSPANTQALARGLTQGMAPVITNQFNQNVATQRGAQDALFGGQGSTVAGLSGLDQTAFGNRQAGVNLAGALPGLYTAPATAALNAANTGYALPFGNLGLLSGLTLPIAGLGQTASGSTSGTTSGSSTSNFSNSGSGTNSGETSASMSPIAMLASLFGGGGQSGAGSAMAGLGNAFGKGLGMLAGLI